LTATIAGNYSMRILFGNKNIFNSPSTFSIYPAQPYVPAFTPLFPLNKECTRSRGCYLGQFIATAGEEAFFQVQSRDRWGNIRKISSDVNLFLNASTGKQDVSKSLRKLIILNGTVANISNGLYRASFVATISGRYNVNIFSRSDIYESVSQSPYTFNVSATAISPGFCYVMERNDLNVVAGRTFFFSIQA
jgi:hypothetical protein